MISSCTDALKTPLHFCTEQVLGRCLPLEPDDATCLGNLARSVYSYVTATFFIVGAAVSTVPWFVGDMGEWLNVGNKPFEDPVSPFEIKAPQTLNPEKTQFMGASMSTYQYTSERDFCENSDWGAYCKKHFTGDKAHLAPGDGVDILIKDDRKILLDAITDAGGNTIRFSVEWADILNEDGSFNDIAMERYVAAAKDCQGRSITPFISLHHFVSPVDENGHMVFENRNSIENFVKYAKYVHGKLSPYTNHFVTFNEPNVNGVMNYVLGDFPAEGIARFWMHEQVSRNMLEAHRRVHEELHKLDGDVEVGITHQALRFSSSSRWNYLARITSFVMTHIFHESFMRWAETNTKSLDFFGVQYYTMPLLGGLPPDSICRENEEMVDAMHFRFHPQGLLPILLEVGKRLGNKVPLLVTETGTAGTNNIEEEDEMDEKRAIYMQQSMEAFRIAQESLNLIGYLYWGIFPNFEWAHGSNNVQNFGMIARDGEKPPRKTKGHEVITQVFKATQAAQDVMVS